MGGDYYDFLELPDGRFGIAIGDVSGKGVGAALMMASLEASLRALASVVDDPAELMERVNGLVYQASSANRYATLFYAQYDPASRRLSYVNAGHNPPVVLRSCWRLVPGISPGDRRSGDRAAAAQLSSEASFLMKLGTCWCSLRTEFPNP